MPCHGPQSTEATAAAYSGIRTALSRHGSPASLLGWVGPRLSVCACLCKLIPDTRPWTATIGHTKRKPTPSRGPSPTFTTDRSPKAMSSSREAARCHPEHPTVCSSYVESSRARLVAALVSALTSLVGFSGAD